MNISVKSKQHVDACKFCWMCHHICPVGNATGHERSTARARALGISFVNNGTMELEEIIENIYECCTCGACVQCCVTGWDTVLFTKEVRLQAALMGKLPIYIQALTDNCIDKGNAYGKTEICTELEKAAARHSKAADNLLFLGSDARYMQCEQAVNAIKVLEKANIDFTVLVQEPDSGAQLDFLIGAAEETHKQMSAAARELNNYKNIIIYDPNDAKTIKRTYKEYGVELNTNIVTFTSYAAQLLKDGKLTINKSEKTVMYQEPYQLARDLKETQAARELISAGAQLRELYLNREETVWAGNILMAQYMPATIKQVAEKRLIAAVSLGAEAIVTASVAEYAALKNTDHGSIEIISLEELILG